MPVREIFVVGASAGGVEALTKLVRGLPTGFPGSLFVVLHTASESPGTLHTLLRRYASMPVVPAIDEGEIQPGHVYVACPNHHLTLERGRMCLGHGPSENRHRPAIDPLFRSAAQNYGGAVVGVLLSGYLDDGVAGLIAIKRHGGVVVVQSLEDALVPDMPMAALEQDHVDFSLPVREMPSLFEQLATQSSLPRVRSKHEAKPMKAKKAGGKRVPKNDVSVFTCPECHGTLWQNEEGGLLQFRCRVGHVFSGESMMDAHAQSLDRALWAALRTLEEHAELSQRLAERARLHKHSHAARRFGERARASKENASVLREMLTADLAQTHTPVLVQRVGSEPPDEAAS